jgi:conjugative transfer signal peptidase TraF
MNMEPTFKIQGNEVPALLRRHPWLSGLSLLLAVVAALSLAFADRQIVINTSPSMPPGVYVKAAGEPAVGRIVDFVVPPPARGYLRARTGNDGARWYLLKPVVAGPGDHVRTAGGWLEINGRKLAPVLMQDGDGRALPRWEGDRTLAPGEFFVVSDRIPTSFDSRYFGPLTRDQIASVRRPLVTW